MIVAIQNDAKNKLFSYLTFILLIVVAWLKPAEIGFYLLKELRLIPIIVFIGFVLFSLAKHLAVASSVRPNELLEVINIYLLMGIVGGYLAQLFSVFDSITFCFPAYVEISGFTDLVLIDSLVYGYFG
ncbi:MAG: hypothetical protein PHG67_08340 [Bacteroidales bacterium]|jgi:hypothetical protein|nr:hypothetical protein [Bacteroidales bacterium]